MGRGVVMSTGRWVGVIGVLGWLGSKGGWVVGNRGPELGWVGGSRVGG